MSRAVDAFPCGSRSTTSTRLPCRARQAARLTAVVVLPTPPFWLAIVMTRQEGGRGHSRSFPPRAASAASAALATGAAWLPATGPGTPPAGIPLSVGPAVLPAGLPRVLTLLLPCASAVVTAALAPAPAGLVSRETAADSACFTRTGG